MANKPTLLEQLIIIPNAQSRILDLEYQATLFTVFHQTPLSRILHTLCMGPIVFTMLILASYIPIGEGCLITGWETSTMYNGSIFLMAFLLAWYFILDLGVGIAVAPVVIGIWMLGNVYNAHFGMQGVIYAIIALFVLSAIQTISHAMEPIPPPHSGTKGFVDIKDWQKTASLGMKVLIGSLFPVFTMVELISSPRLMPIIGLRTLHILGYKPEIQKRCNERAQKILATGDYNQ